jgi:hypothetical protein
MRSWRAGLVCAGILAAASSTALAQANLNLTNGSTNFQTLGFIDTNGPAVESHAQGISPDGNTVVGYSFDSNGLEAFSWNKSNPTTLTPLGSLGPPPYGSAGNAVSNPILGGPNLAVGTTTTVTSGATEAMHVRTDGTGMAAFPGLNPTLTQNNTANGISADGTHVVGATFKANTPGSITAATLWQMNPSTGAVTTTTELANFTTFTGTGYNAGAQGITNDGSVAVGFGADTVNGSNVTKAAYWKIDATGTPGTAQPLPELSTTGPFESQARGVSLAGTNPDLTPGGTFLAVGYSRATNQNGGSSSQAVVWTVNSGTATVQGLGFLGQPPSGPFLSIADAISAQKGSENPRIVGQSSSADPDSGSIFREAFLYIMGDSDGMLSLKRLLNNNSTNQNYPNKPQYNLGIPTTFKLIEATAISADGNTIAGYGLDTITGNEEAWVVTLAVPEPGTLSMAAAATVSLLGRRRRRRSR